MMHTCGYYRFSYSKCQQIIIEEVPEVNCCSFMNTLTFSMSSDTIAIYVPRAFQRAAPRPLIRQHVEKATPNARTVEILQCVTSVQVSLHIRMIEKYNPYCAWLASKAQ